MDHVPPQPEHDADGRKPPLKRLLLIGLALVFAILFTGLGVWQLERRAWKLELIARVQSRVHVPAVPLAQAKPDEYRRVRVTGIFVRDRDTLTQALTERGAGYWVLTPLRTSQGVVLINRGFVPPEHRAPGLAHGLVTVTGLIRVSEPRGGFLRANQPGANRWYSRDVMAIARAKRLGPVASFFIDADATPNPGGYPIGGLTVVRFRNAHLVYALTWFVLAGLSLFAVMRLRTAEQR